MAEIPVAAFKSIARELDLLQLDYAFTGGSVIGLLLDHPELTPIRPTDDVDIIVELIARPLYAEFERRLRRRGFVNDARAEAPICRWVFNTMTIDIMPVAADFLGLNTIWFDRALSGALVIEIDGQKVRHVSAPAFLATKLAAFHDRGQGDYYGSHDLEDLVAVIDGRELVVEELRQAESDLRAYVAGSVAALMKTRSFVESLPGHLASDSGSQARLPILKNRLLQISAMR